MSYTTANRRWRAREWTFNNEEVRAFAAAMVDVGHITDVDVLQDYYDKPHNWSREHAWWVENDRTHDETRWGDGEDERFET